MSAAGGVRSCPHCGATGDAMLTLDRYGVKTFFCTKCEDVWDVDRRDDPDEPDDPSTPPNDTPGP